MKKVLMPRTLNTLACLVLLSGLLSGAVSWAGQAPTQPPEPSPEESKWREAVKTVWAELMVARKLQNQLSVDSPSFPEAPRNTGKIENRLELMISEGIRLGYRTEVAETEPLRDVMFPEFEPVAAPQTIIPQVRFPSDEETRAATQKSPEGSVHVAKVFSVMPGYPLLARQARVQGQVKAEVLVSQDGKVVWVKCTNGHPLFYASVLSAVSQWRFQPPQVDGKPMAVRGVLTLTFSL